MIDPTSAQRRERGPFVPADPMRKAEPESQQRFAARHFAAQRAGFLLREHRRQQTSPIDAADAPSADGAFRDALGGTGHDLSEMRSDTIAPPGPPVATGVPHEEVERLVAEAEQRGRAEGQAALVTVLDQAIAALDAAGRAVGETQDGLERRWIVPLAQASLHIGGELARQSLTDAGGLQRYIEAVTAALRPRDHGADHDSPASPVEVRLNPEDLAVLERASFRPAAITLVADPLVPRAGAIASSDDKVVDDRFENRVRFAKEAVLAAAADLLREAPS